jgi:hypothetical protein
VRDTNDLCFVNVLDQSEFLDLRARVVARPQDRHPRESDHSKEHGDKREPVPGPPRDSRVTGSVIVAVAHPREVSHP